MPASNLTSALLNVVLDEFDCAEIELEPADRRYFSPLDLTQVLAQILLAIVVPFLTGTASSVAAEYLVSKLKASEVKQNRSMLDRMQRQIEFALEHRAEHGPDPTDVFAAMDRVRSVLVENEISAELAETLSKRIVEKLHARLV